MNYAITSIPPESDKITDLTAALYRDLELKNGKGRIGDFIAENKNMLIFFIKMNDGIPAACGALKHFDNKTAEVKECMLNMSSGERDYQN